MWSAPCFVMNVVLAMDALPNIKNAWSCPSIDLDVDEISQVVVDREEGQYLGHISTILLEDSKTILASYPKGHGRGPAILKRSEDGGRERGRGTGVKAGLEERIVISGRRSRIWKIKGTSGRKQNAK